jgi:hypothetical protein
MDFNATIDLIIKDLRETAEIIDDLKKYQGVPLLQVELAKSKCKSAGDVISLLKNMSDQLSVVTAPAVEYEPPEVIIRSPASTPEPAIASEPVNAAGPENAPKAVITSAPVLKTGDSKKTHEKVSEYSIVADKFSPVHGRFENPAGSQEPDPEVSDVLNTKTVTNLSEAIGLNDKFLFIGEIFHGNKDAYAQTISRLDKAENLADAKSIIMSYTGNSIENEAIKQLLRLVKRKFPLHE